MSVRLRLFALPAVAALAATAFIACGDDDDSAGSTPIVSDAYAQFTKSDLGGVYFDITGAQEDDELVGASTDIATAEIHESVTEGATGTMQHVESVAIPAGETVVFEPGAYHVMLTDVTDLPEEGGTFEIELEFANSGTMTVEVEVDLVLAGGDDDDQATGDGEEDHEGH